MMPISNDRTVELNCQILFIIDLFWIKSNNLKGAHTNEYT